LDCVEYNKHQWTILLKNKIANNDTLNSI